MTTQFDRDAFARRVAKIIPDPVRFTRRILRRDVWGTQARLLRSVATSRRTAAKACHSSGKSYTAACAVLWWMIRNGIVITTAPTWTQVKKVLWGEVHSALQGAPLLKILAPGMEVNQTELKLGPHNYAIGLSTNEGVNFQGYHGQILIVMDEAPGVRPDIWEAIEGIRAGGDVRILALGNPVIASGPFYDAFHSQRATWDLVTISAFDTPNLEGLDIEGLCQLGEDELDHNPRPYLTTRRWVREKYTEWGESSPLYQSRVLGQFPTESQGQLISLAWIEAAINREQVPCNDMPEAGVDVAGPGEDETVVRVRQGPNLLGGDQWTEPDPRGKLAAYLGEIKRKKGALKVKVDSIGIGYYMARHLSDVGFDVTDVNVGEAPNDSERYANLKAELYWGLRQRFEAGDVAGQLDDMTQGQLTSIRYGHTARGQVLIESKADAKKRGVRSPDRAESWMLAFAPSRDVVCSLPVVTSASNWR